MTWNYRIVKHADKKNKMTWYSLHEVYYEKNSPWGMTENPVAAGGDTVKEVIKSLEMMLKDAKKSPVFIPPKKWSKP